MIEGETLGTIGMGVGIFGLLVAFMLYRKVDSIEIENKTVAKITERIQDGAMAFMVAEYRMLTIFIAVVVASFCLSEGAITMTLEWRQLWHS